MPTVSCQTQLSGPVTLTSTAVTMLIKSQRRRTTLTSASRSLAQALTSQPSNGFLNAHSSPSQGQSWAGGKPPRVKSPLPAMMTSTSDSSTYSSGTQPRVAGLLELVPTHNQVAEQLLDSVAEPGAAFIDRRRVLEIIVDLMACADGKLDLPSRHTTPALSHTNNLFSSMPELKLVLQRQDSAMSVQAPQPQTTRTDRAEMSAEEFDGTFTLNQYVMLQSIGHGAQGEVFLSVDTDKNEMRAIKAIPRPKVANRLHFLGDTTNSAGLQPRSPLELARANRAAQHEREIEVMKRCRHRNIVSLYEVIDDPSSDKLYLVMQYIEHGSLVTLLPDGTASQVVRPDILAQYTRQLCAGLQYLHSHGVVHRDIKPDNILLGADDTVYLSDFGVADVFDVDTPCQNSPIIGTRGTSAFLAPELVDPSTTGAVDGRCVDIWALGVTLYVMLYGCLPWNRDGSTFEFWRRVLEVDPPLPCIDSYNEAADRAWRALLQAMLHKDPMSRCTAEQARAKAKAIEEVYNVGSPQVGPLLTFDRFPREPLDLATLVVPPQRLVHEADADSSRSDASFNSRTMMPHEKSVTVFGASACSASASNRIFASAPPTE